MAKKSQNQRPHVVIDEDILKIFRKENEKGENKGTPIFVLIRKCLEESETFKKLQKVWSS